MKRISSRATVFYKWLFPMFWFGFLVLFASTAFRSPDGVPWFGLGVPLVMAVLGFFVFRTLVWSLADEVLDGGDYLLVRRAGEQERIPLSNIINVNSAVQSNPQRIVLKLARPGRFGDEVAFSPVTTFSLNPLAKNAVAEDLMVRVDQARSRRPS